MVMEVADYFWIEVGWQKGVAIPLAQTREVLSFPLNSLCSIPGVRPGLLGVTNQRGSLRWVVDLPRLLDPTQGDHQLQSSLGENVRAVVLAGKTGQVAAIAKTFRGIVTGTATALDPTDAFPLFINAQVSQEEDWLGVLDVDQVFHYLQGG